MNFSAYTQDDIFVLDCFHSPPTLALVMCCSGDPFPISICDLTLFSYIISFHFDTFYQTLMK